MSRYDHCGIYHSLPALSMSRYDHCGIHHRHESVNERIVGFVGNPKLSEICVILAECLQNSIHNSCLNHRALGPFYSFPEQLYHQSPEWGTLTKALPLKAPDWSRHAATAECDYMRAAALSCSDAASYMLHN